VDLVCLQWFHWGLVLGCKCKEVQDGNWFKALVSKHKVVWSKAELLNKLHLAGVPNCGTARRRQAGRGRGPVLWSCLHVALVAVTSGFLQMSMAWRGEAVPRVTS